MDSPKGNGKKTGMMGNVKTHFRNMSIFSTKSSRVPSDSTQVDDGECPPLVPRNTPIKSPVCAAPVFTAASPQVLTEVSIQDGKHMVPGGLNVIGSSDDNDDIFVANTLDNSEPQEGSRAVGSFFDDNGPASTDPGSGVIEHSKINASRFSSSGLQGSGVWADTPDVDSGEMNTHGISSHRLDLSRWDSSAAVEQLLGRSNDPFDPDSSEFTDGSPYQMSQRNPSAAAKELLGRPNNPFDPDSGEFPDGNPYNAPRRDASAAAAKLLGRTNGPFDPDSSEFAKDNPYDALRNGMSDTPLIKPAFEDSQNPNASPAAQDTNEPSGHPTVRPRVITSVLGNDNSGFGNNILYETATVTAVQAQANHSISKASGSAPFPAHFTSSAPDSSPIQTGDGVFLTVPKKRQRMGQGEEPNWQLHYKASVGSFYERKSSKGMTELPNGTQQQGSLSSSKSISETPSFISVGVRNNDRELSLHEQENMLDIIAELYDAACGNTKGGDLHDSLMAQNHFFVSKCDAELPADAPARHMHIIDWQRFVMMGDSNNIIEYLKPRLCDAVATVLYETDPKSLAAFLDGAVESFEWRHTMSASAYRSAKCAMIRRGGNEIICGTYSNVGFRYIWDKLVKSRIHFNGKWSEVWAGAGGSTRLTADGPVFSDYTSLAVGGSENADDANFALWMGRQLAASFLEMERDSSGRQLKIWQFGGEQGETLEWEMDGAVTKSVTRGYGTFVPVAEDEE